MFEDLKRESANYLRDFAARLLGVDRMAKQALVLCIDLILAYVAVVVSFSLRLGFWDVYSDSIFIFFFVQVLLFTPIFIVRRMYQNLFRYHGARGLRELVFACLLLTVPNVWMFGVISWDGIPRTLSVLFPWIFFSFVALTRVMARVILMDLVGENVEKRNAVIYGAGLAGRQLALSLSHEKAYNLVGYIDDDPTLSRIRLEGVAIYPSSKLEDVVERYDIAVVFLAMPALRRTKKAKVIKRLQHLNVKVLSLPAINEILDGEVSFSDLREVDVADLLSRDPVAPDPGLLGLSITGKTVVVTGAGGSIGSELARQILRLRPAKLVLLDMSEAALYMIDQEVRTYLEQEGQPPEIVVTELASVEKKSAVRRIFRKHKPHTVFHAAAYKHVPIVEDNVVAGVGNNVLGTMYCAKAACAADVERFVLVSTDKAVRPTNVMGASKRVCELVLQALAEEEGCRTIFSMVRFGNVLASSGSVVPLFRQQIAEGGPVTLTHQEITRYFMTIPEAAELVIQAGALARGGEVYLLDMGDSVKIIDLAKTMIRLSGRSVRDEENPEGDIEIVESGLRPGEKLFEELLIDAKAEETPHKRVFKAKEARRSWPELESYLSEIENFVRRGDAEALRNKVWEVITF